MDRVGLWEVIRQDVGYALRGMRHNIGFSLAVVLTLALGIGANTAMFSVVHAILLKPLAYSAPDRLVVFTRGATPSRFEEAIAGGRSYSGVGAYANIQEDLALSSPGEPEVLKAARVSANFLDILGVAPRAGRSFRPEEGRPGAPDVAIISSELWQRRFSGDSSLVGKNVTLAGTPYLIIGVLPAGFQFPFPDVDVWVSKPSELSVIEPASRPLSPTLRIFARLNAGADLQQANAELSVLRRQYAAAHPTMLDATPNPPEQVRSLKDALVSDVRSKLWMLFGAVGLVLLIVCANVGSLLLARASSRSREFAVRAAVGAGRGRIIAQLLAESVLLACVGGVLGIALAASTLAAIPGATFLDLPRAGEIRMDSMVLAFALGLSVFTGLAFGLAPSLAASRPDLAGVLRGSGEVSMATGFRQFLRFGPRGLLVAGQVALSIVLLIGATLLIESLVRLNRIDPGFQPDNLLALRLSFSPARYDSGAKRAAFCDRLLEHVQSLPGVSSASVTLTLPMGGWAGVPVQAADAPPLKLNERPIAILQTISPQYFRTMEIALRRGREFTAHDNADSVQVIIINEALARLLWPQYPGGRDPIGQNILVGRQTQPWEVAGIAADVHQTGMDDDPKPGIYVPYPQNPLPSVTLAVRTIGNPRVFAKTIQNQILAIDAGQPVSHVAAMGELIEASQGQLQLMTRLLAGFAASATLLAMIGLYGVISYNVVQRARELGIRRALGAQRKHVLSLVIGQGFVMSMTGVLVGVGVAFALTRVLKSWLFHVSATDPLTFAAAGILLILAALAASYIPARRATAIDPLKILRAG